MDSELNLMKTQPALAIAVSKRTCFSAAKSPRGRGRRLTSVFNAAQCLQSPLSCASKGAFSHRLSAKEWKQMAKVAVTDAVQVLASLSGLLGFHQGFAPTLDGLGFSWAATRRASPFMEITHWFTWLDSHLFSIIDDLRPSISCHSDTIELKVNKSQ